MAELDTMQTVIKQVGIQAVAVVALKEQDTGPIIGANKANVGQAFRPRHGRPALR